MLQNEVSMTGQSRRTNMAADIGWVEAAVEERRPPLVLE